MSEPRPRRLLPSGRRGLATKRDAASALCALAVTLAAVSALAVAVPGCQDVDEDALAERIEDEIEPRIRAEIEADLEKRMREEVDERLAIQLDTRLIALGLQEPAWRPPPPAADAAAEDPDAPTGPTPHADDIAADALGAAESGEDPVEPEEIQPLVIEKALIARAIERRQPIDPGTRFPADVRRLYCYVQVDNASGPERKIEVSWVHAGDVRKRTKVSVGRSPSWRTWARTPIDPTLFGPWRCEVRDDQDAILRTVEFTIEEPYDEDEDNDAD